MPAATIEKPSEIEYIELIEQGRAERDIWRDNWQKSEQAHEKLKTQIRALLDDPDAVVTKTI
jgi:hypothetical protein